jgi:hypothetical protein
MTVASPIYKIFKMEDIMINIVQCNIQSDSIPIPLFNIESKYVFFAEFNHINRVHLKIIKIDIKKQTVASYELKHPANFLTTKLINDKLYYGNQNAQLISLYSVELEKFMEEEVYSYNVPFTINDMFNPILFSLEPFLILAIPNPELDKNSYYYRNIILIDTEQNTDFEVRIDLGNTDSILRLDNIWISDDGKNLVLKTGRIRNYEKKKFWERKISSGFNDSTDQIENLIIFELNNLIACCKHNIALTNYEVLQFSDESSTNGFIGFDNSNVIYFVNVFSEGVSFIKILDLESKMINSIRLDTIYDSINYKSDIFYGEKNGHTYNLLNYEVYTNNRIVDQDAKFEISYIKEPEITNGKIAIKCSISIYRRADKNLINSFVCNHFIFDYNTNSLLLFTNSL